MIEKVKGNIDQELFVTNKRPMALIVTKLNEVIDYNNKLIEKVNEHDRLLKSLIKNRGDLNDKKTK